MTMTVNAEVLADIVTKYGEFPDGQPTTPDETLDLDDPPPADAAVAAAPEASEGSQPAPEDPPSAAPPAPQPDIAALIADAVAKALANAAPAPAPFPQPSPPAPMKPAITLDDFLADPAGVMQRNQIPLEHVARSMVSAQMRAAGQQPPPAWEAQVVVQPQMAQLSGMIQALTGELAEMKSERRRDTYVADLATAVDAASEDKFPQMIKARAKDRAKVMKRVNAEVAARAKFADPKASAPTHAEILAAVEAELAEVADLVGAPVTVPPVVVVKTKTPVPMPSTFRGSPPAVGTTVADEERRIRNEVIRKYETAN